MQENQGCLQNLKSKDLTAVSFVLDYLRLEFEDTFLTILSDPVVVFAGVEKKAGMAGYRDTLCERISQTITEATEQKGEHVRLSFGDGSTLTIPLQSKERKGSEAATLQVPNQGLCVWHFE